MLTTGVYGADFSNWWQDTPYGNEIAYDDWGTGSSIFVHCRRERNRSGVDDLRRWYFYRNTIVGELDDAAGHRYFAFNESTCETSYFTDRREFNRYIERSDLRPRLWTRWYDSYHGVIYSSVRCFACRPGRILLLWFVSAALPLQIVAVLMIGCGAAAATRSAAWAVRTGPNRRLVRNGVTILLIVGLIARVALDVYPHSV